MTAECLTHKQQRRLTAQAEEKNKAPQIKTQRESMCMMAKETYQIMSNLVQIELQRKEQLKC